MKVIDLLNKIANGEEAPKKIKVYNDIFILDEGNNVYESERTRSNLLYIYNGNIFKYEVEIIEEDKKIEKIELEDDGNTISLICKKKNEWTILDNVEVEICNKINEIIEYLEENKND